ncbi:hypothetical protein HMI55_002734, partial [Coelomomyces lativittatus]
MQQHFLSSSNEKEPPSPSSPPSPPSPPSPLLHHQPLQLQLMNEKSLLVSNQSTPTPLLKEGEAFFDSFSTSHLYPPPPPSPKQPNQQPHSSNFGGLLLTTSMEENPSTSLSQQISLMEPKEKNTFDQQSLMPVFPTTTAPLSSLPSSPSSSSSSPPLFSHPPSSSAFLEHGSPQGLDSSSSPTIDISLGFDEVTNE